MADEEMMSIPRMKKLLNGCSQEKPLRVAVCQNGEAGVAYFDKVKQPKALEAEIKKDFKDAKSIRFGTAAIDLDNDKQINLSLNKPVSGLCKRLMKSIKLTGYNKVVIITLDENGNEVRESAGDEDETEAAASGAAAPPPPAPPPPAAAPLDAAGLMKKLGALALRVKSLAATEPARAAPLAKLAGDAGAALKVPNLATAAELIAQIEAGLNAPSGATAEVSGGPKVAFAKSRLLWLAARKKIESETEKLRTAIVDTYKEEGIADELDKRFKTKVAPFLDRYDEKLADVLDEASNAADEGIRANHVAAAKKLIAEYQGKLASDPDIADLDNNPFAPLAIQQTVNATLSQLAKTVV